MVKLDVSSPKRKSPHEKPTKPVKRRRPSSAIGTRDSMNRLSLKPLLG
jgi:hypothetical protein